MFNNQRDNQIKPSLKFHRKIMLGVTIMKFKRMALMTILIVVALVLISGSSSIAKILEADGHQVLKIIWDDIGIDWIYVKDAWSLITGTIPGEPIILILTGLMFLVIIIYVLTTFRRVFFKSSFYEIPEKQDKTEQNNEK